MLISSLTLPFDFDPNDNALFGVCFIACGLLGSFLSLTLLDKTRKFKCLHATLISIALVGLPLVIIGLKQESEAVLAIANGLLGLGVLPLLPVSMEFGAELTYPNGASLMGGVLLGTSQLSACLMILIGQFLISTFSVLSTYIALILLALVALMLSLFTAQDLRRFRADSNAFEILRSKNAL